MITMWDWVFSKHTDHMPMAPEIIININNCVQFLQQLFSELVCPCLTVMNSSSNLQSSKNKIMWRWYLKWFHSFTWIMQVCFGLQVTFRSLVPFFTVFVFHKWILFWQLLCSTFSSSSENVYFIRDRFRFACGMGGGGVAETVREGVLSRRRMKAMPVSPFPQLVFMMNLPCLKKDPDPKHHPSMTSKDAACLTHELLEQFGSI